MKKILFSLVVLLGCFSIISAQTKKMDPVTAEKQELQGPKMTFANTVVDYGTIAQHSETLRVVKFTNTGTEPLVIKNARGSCGCTVPSWPKEPVMPGETGQIEIRYDTKRLGGINKKVTITTNEGTEPHVLSVIGKINKTDESEGVPKAPKTLIKKNNN